MQSAFSLNVGLNYLKDKGKTLDRLRRLNPAYVFVRVLSLNDYAAVREFDAALPDTRVIVRVYDGDDAQFHMPGDDNGSILSPQSVIDQWGKFGHDGLILALQNEPDGYGAQSLGRINDWVTSIAPIASRTQTHILVYGFAVGHPAEVTFPEGDGFMWRSSLHESLKMVAHHHDFVGIHVHEYLPSREPDRTVGRMNDLLNAYAYLGLAPPDIFVTEFGADDVGSDGLNGYKSRGWSGAEYANRCIQVYREKYDYLVRAGYLKAICIFTEGENPKWENWNVEQDDGFHNELDRQRSTFALPQSAAPEIDWQWGEAAPNGPYNVNVRDHPATSGSTVITRLTGATRVQWAHYNDDWAHIRISGKAGFISIAWATFTPDPEPIPLPQNPDPNVDDIWLRFIESFNDMINASIEKQTAYQVVSQTALALYHAENRFHDAAVKNRDALIEYFGLDI